MAYHPALLLLLVAVPAAALGLRLAWPAKRPPKGAAAARVFLVPPAAALLAAGLATIAAAYLAARAEPIPLDALLGEWEVYNDDDALLVGLWCIEGTGPDDLSVRLIVYGFEDPHSTAGEDLSTLRHESCSRASEEVAEPIAPGLGRPPIYPVDSESWPLHVGPFPLRRVPLSGVLEFDYRSPWGCGQARLSPAWGFFGTYLRGRPAAGDEAGPVHETADSEEILVLREGKTAYRRERTARRWVRNRVVGSAWIALAVAALVAEGIGWRRKRAGSPSLILAAALFVVAFAGAVALFASFSPPPHAFTPESARGPWHVEYVSDRAHAGSVEWTEEGGEALLVGELRRRGERSEPRPIVAGPVDLDREGLAGFVHRAEIPYSTGEERGDVTLREVPAMTGPFHDHRLDEDCPGGNDKNLNYGDFIAFKRPEGR